MRAWDWLLDPGLCLGCGICADLCPVDALEHPPAAPLPRVLPGRCTGCRICLRECPTGAIALRPAGERPGTAP